MTHPAHTSASTDPDRTAAPDRPDSDPDRTATTDRPDRTATTDRPDRTATTDRPDRSRPGLPADLDGHDHRTFPAAGHDGRASRARAEPMAVWPLRDGRYLVDREGRTYVVDAERATCTCPDSAIRGARCKHVRRVAIEIEAGLVPAPDERERACAVCGGSAFVAADARGPALCPRHDHDPGALVADRETGTLLVVVEAIEQRADDARTDEGRFVADYDTNAAYGRHEPVFAARYVEALPTGVSRGHHDAASGRRYLFPASRLRPVGTDRSTTDRPTGQTREQRAPSARAG